MTESAHRHQEVTRWPVATAQAMGTPVPRPAPAATAGERIATTTPAPTAAAAARSASCAAARTSAVLWPQSAWFSPVFWRELAAGPLQLSAEVAYGVWLGLADLGALNSEVVGSNPATPTKCSAGLRAPVLHYGVACPVQSGLLLPRATPPQEWAAHCVAHSAGTLLT